MEKTLLCWDQIGVSLNGSILQIFVDGKIVAEISDCNESYLQNEDFIAEVLDGLGYTVR